MSSIAEEIDELTGLRKKTMWWLRRAIPTVALVGLAIVLLYSAFALKQTNQKGKMDIPPGNHYPALR